ncbi:SDR family oxidoreductase [Streptomyces lavendulocolor]|uniref:SDR family oxidoreductase n=1 Tax=Streptomyces lavendulocolor TaxID=67316 RepID=UPI0033F40B10
MDSTGEIDDLVIGISPLGEPDARLVTAVSCAGGLGVLDLGKGDRKAREALEWVRRWSPTPFGVRVAAGCRLSPAELGAPTEGDPYTVVLSPDSPWRVTETARNYRTLVEVASLEEALDALRAGAHGLIARGCESGGRVGELSTFVLLQQLMSAAEVTLPVWACGGIGPSTAAAAVVGGAAGVVLDTQLALLAESDLCEETAAVLRAMDGSETTVVDGRRVLARRRPDVMGSRLSGEHVGQRPGSVSLAVGQDGFLAARFAEWWGTVGVAVRAIRAAVEGAAHLSAPQSSLCSASPMSRALGTQLPVAQGPMTRVSDRAEFAAAVAQEGALPFVALSLANADQTRTLLNATSTALAGRPWGVGLLGFAPEALRECQTEAVLQMRPSHVIIAGGRPSQAASFEQAGIATFLHVPSPGLLRQFLQAGARRFVFEGSECGGHVGPRYSFPLWEAQISVLNEHLDTSEEPASSIEVFFAGGIHDERSSAMITALSAQLAARGVAVGILMGTAYVFTEEVVTSGALQRTFQRKVVAAQRTMLLETAPGHATRCVPSHFSRSYEVAKAELAEAGVTGRQLWEDLERLNVGRLRIASKGVQRQGEELVEVNAGRQLAEGLYMAGDVAVLRSATTTIAALHHAVTRAAADFFSERVAMLRDRLGLRVREDSAGSQGPAPLDIAVVGMACMFPQAPDLATFWANIVGGVDAVMEVPAERWDPALHYQSDGAAARSGMSGSKWGGFLPRITFDALDYGIPPASLSSIEPVQLLALEAARRALDDAGYGESKRSFDRSRASVVFGAEAGSDQATAVLLPAALRSCFGEVPEELADQLPALTEDSFPGMLANVISGRIANRLDLGGANYTVDAACASSLAAVDVACKELSSGTSDLVLCGGADLHNGINDYVLFSSVHALSPTGRSRAFDSAADGIALGEGVACLVLKRLSDAERDGDRVYSVIKGIGASSDGRSLGLTAPRPQGQRAALQRAYRSAGVSPADVGLLEAHGTGTVVGDRTELTTLTDVFTEAGAKAGTCTLGSVKSQIGHTKCAAGLAGFIKAAMAVYTGVKPPTLHLKQPNPAWQANNSPFVFHTSATPWAAQPAKRVAGVSAFGFGGTNFHTVLTAHDKTPPPQHGLHEWPAELLLFRGATPAAAHQAIKDILALLEEAEAGDQGWRLRDLARAASQHVATNPGPVQAAIVATGLSSLGEQLRRALAGDHAPAAGVYLAAAQAQLFSENGGPGKTAFLFPGQGSQRPGMLAQQFVAFPGLQGNLQTTPAFADALYPPSAFDTIARDKHHATLTDTRIAQPALGIAGIAAHTLLTKAGVSADMTAGHSYGELTALCVAGVFPPQTLLKLSSQRAEAITEAIGQDPGAMAAVSASRHEIDEVLREGFQDGRVVVANHNAPQQSVISGPTAAVDSAVELLRSAGHSAKRLAVACAFHSPLVEGATARFAHALKSHSLCTPEVPVWSNRTAAPYPTSPAAIAAELASQISAPVHFADEIEAMYAAGARVFVEAGPGSVLTDLVSKVLGERAHLAVACEPRSGDGMPGFLSALAQLAVAGVPVRTDWMFRGRDTVDAGRTTRPKRPGWSVDGQGVWTADGELLSPTLRLVARKERPMFSIGPAGSQPSDRDSLIHEYLRTSREMVAAHREVVLSYLGALSSLQAGPAPAPISVPSGRGFPQQAVDESPSKRLAPAEPAAAPAALAAGASPAAPSEADMLRTVMEIISARTGYPIDMIEPDLDLEADLSVDSIKRAEIAGELATRLGMSADGGVALLADRELEELSSARSAAAIAGWLTSRLIAPDRPVGPSAPPPAGPTPAQDPGPGFPQRAASVTQPALAPAALPPQRLRLSRVALPDLSVLTQLPTVLAAKRFVILGDVGPLAQAVASALTRLGAKPELRPGNHVLTEEDGAVDGVLYLQPLNQASADLLPQAFPVIKQALARTPRWLLAARWSDGVNAPGTTRLGAAGLRGLFRTIGKEHPEMVTKVVEMSADASRPVAAMAEMLTAELFTHDHPVILRDSTGRYGLELKASPLNVASGSAPGRQGEESEAATMGLDSESVVIFTGGARGITARCAVAFAAASRCRIELIGRTPLPSAPESPSIAAAHDSITLRAALAAEDGNRSAADIHQAVSRILAQREIQATLDELRALGSSARYRCIDVREEAAVTDAVNQIFSQYGRLDGVVHAAGVIEDRLVSDKTPESFKRVFDCKAGGAVALLNAVGTLPIPPGFVVLFGSISAVTGNRGQADYAAANDAQEELAARWAAATGRRALTVHWGPWAPEGKHTGMVTPALANHYAKRGISLIDPKEGPAALLRELAWGDPSHTSVIYTASSW